MPQTNDGMTEKSEAGYIITKKPDPVDTGLGIHTIENIVSQLYPALGKPELKVNELESESKRRMNTDPLGVDSIVNQLYPMSKAPAPAPKPVEEKSGTWERFLDWPFNPISKEKYKEMETVDPEKSYFSPTIPLKNQMVKAGQIKEGDKFDELGRLLDEKGNELGSPPRPKSAFPEFGQYLSAERGDVRKDSIFKPRLSEDKSSRSLIRRISNTFDSLIGKDPKDRSFLSDKAKASVVEVLANEAGMPVHEYTKTNNYFALAAENFVDSMMLGIPSAIRKELTGEEGPKPYDVPGYAIKATASLAGLITGPFSMGIRGPGSALHPWGLFRKYPSAVQTDPLAYRILSRAFHDIAVLAPAGALSAAGPILESTTFSQGAKHIKQGIVGGTITAGIFGVSTGLFPKEGVQQAARLITGLALINAHRAIEVGGNPFTNRPIGEVFFDIGMDVFFLRRGLPKSTFDARAKEADVLINSINALDIVDRAVRNIEDPVVRNVELAKLNAERTRINSLIERFADQFEGDVALAEEYALQQERKAQEKFRPIKSSVQMVRLANKLKREQAGIEAKGEELKKEAETQPEVGETVVDPETGKKTFKVKEEPERRSKEYVPADLNETTKNFPLGKETDTLVNRYRMEDNLHVDGEGNYKIDSHLEATEIARDKGGTVIPLSDGKFAVALEPQKRVMFEKSAIDKGAEKQVAKDAEQKLQKVEPELNKKFNELEVEEEISPQAKALWDRLIEEEENTYSNKDYNEGVKDPVEEIAKSNIETIPDVRKGTKSEPIKNVEDTTYYQDKEKTIRFAKDFETRKRSVETVPEVLVQKLINDVNRAIHGEIPNAKDASNTLSEMAANAEMFNTSELFNSARDFEAFKEHLIDAATWARKIVEPPVSEKISPSQLNMMIPVNYIPKLVRDTWDMMFGFSDSNYKTDSLKDPMTGEYVDKAYRNTALFKATGFWLGKDGLWRYEIDDSKGRVLINHASEAEGKRLGDIYHHPELYKLFPELADKKIELITDTNSTTTGALREDGILLLNKNIEDSKGYSWTKNISTMLEHTIIHESNHHIQQSVNMGVFQGSNADYESSVIMSRRLRAINNEIKDPFTNAVISGIIKDLDMRSDIGHFNKRILPLIEINQKTMGFTPSHIETLKKYIPGFERYRKVPGEQESRLSSYRMFLTAQERRDIPPWKSLDIMLKQEGYTAEQVAKTGGRLYGGLPLDEMIRTGVKAYHWSKEQLFGEFDFKKLGEGTKGRNLQAVESAKLGAWFTENDKPITEELKERTEVRLNIKNPLVINNETVPEIDIMGDKIKDAKQWLMDEVERAGGGEKYREELKKKGYDGIILQDSEFDNKKSYVVFDKGQIATGTFPELVNRDWKELQKEDEKLKDDITSWLMGETTKMPEPSQIYRGVPKGVVDPVKAGTEYVHGTPWGFSAARGGKGAFGDPTGHNVYSIPATKDTIYYRGGALEGDPLERTRIKNAKGMTWDELMKEAKTLYQNEVIRERARDRERGEILGEDVQRDDYKYIADSVANDLSRASFETDMRGKEGIWRGQHVPYELDRELPRLRSYDTIRSVIEAKRQAGFPDDQIPELKIIGRDKEGNKLYSIPPLGDMLKTIKKGADDFDKALRESRKANEFKLGEATTRFREEFVRKVIDRSGNIRLDLLDKLGDPGYQVVQRMVLQKGSSALAALNLKQMNAEVYDGKSSEHKLILDGILMARRMVAIYKSGSKMNFPEDYTPEKSIYFLESFPKKYGLSNEETIEFLRAADAYETWMKKALKDSFDSGLISEKSYDELSKHMYRRIGLADVFDKKSVSEIGGKLTTVYDSGIEALQKGKKTDIFERSGEIMALEVFNRTYSRIMKNEANKILMEVARDLPDNDFVRVKTNKEDKIPRGWTRVFAFEEGKRKSLFISPDMAKEWLSSSPETTYEHAKLLRWLSGSQVLRTFATGIDWGFALANIPRDVMHIHYAARRFVDGEWKNVYNPISPIYGIQMGRDMAAVWSDTMNRKGRYLEYIKEGGGMEFLVHQGRLFQRGRHLGSKMDKGQDALSYFGESSEILTRLAVRERTIRKLAGEQGISMKEARKNKKITQEATFVARDYMDFGQGGSTTKAFDNYFPYVNATVQGTRGMMRAFKPMGGSSLSSMFKVSQFGLTVAGVTIAAWKFAPETTAELQGNIAMDNNLCVPIGDGFGFEDENGDMRYPFIKVPLDPGQKFFKVFFEAATNKYVGKDFDAGRVAKSLASLSPVGTSTLPPTIAATFGYTHNKDFWRAKEVWDKTNKTLHDPSKEIIPGETPQAFIDLGEATGLSPERAKYAAGEIIPSSSMWAAIVGMGYDKVFGDQPKSYKQQHLAQVLAKLPVINRFFGITNPYSKSAKVIEEAEGKSVLKKFVENSGIDTLVKGNLYEKNVSEEEIYNYINKFDDKDTRNRLMGRYKWEVAIKDLPEKSFWRRLNGLSPDARAEVFVDRLNKSSDAKKEKLWNEYAIVAKAGGVISKEFRNEVMKIMKVPE